VISSPGTRSEDHNKYRVKVAEDTDVKDDRPVFLTSSAIVGNEALAQAPSPPPAPPPPYGAPINLADAKKAADAAVAEVAKVGSAPDAIAIVDHGGFLIYFERMDNTSLGAVENAINKARSAAMFRRPTKVFEDAIGVGGGTAQQDGQVAKAGADAIK
jgi:uncharacterized protein GlcG (DUF336 family)